MNHSTRGVTVVVWLVVCGAALLPLAAWATEAWPLLTLLALILFVVAAWLVGRNMRMPS